MEVGRNDPCPCGSGEKYKKCCEGKAHQAWSIGAVLLAVVLGLIALAGIYAFWANVVAPPEPAAPGRVWSPEHGHYHDAP